MKKLSSIFSKVAGLFLLAIFAVGCHMDSDVDYNNVTPPEVEVAKSNLSGIVTTKKGAAIEGAVVTLNGQSVETNSTGYYIITDIESGSYPIVITADGYITNEGVVDFPVSSTTFNLVYNVSLAAEESVAPVVVTPGAGGEGETTTEALDQNDPAEIDIQAVIPPGTVNEEVTFYIIPLYNENDVNPTSDRAAKENDDFMLIGCTFACSVPDIVLNNPVALTFTLDEEMIPFIKAKFYDGTEWVDIAYTTENGVVTILIEQLGSYGIFLPFVISETTSTNPLEFEQTVWDNLYGSAPVYVAEAKYIYYVGTSINVAEQSHDVLSALLIEKLAARYGTTSQQVNGVYPLNVILPIGVLLEVSGTQAVNNVTASYGQWSVSGTNFDIINIVTETRNRQHNGGDGGSK